MSHTPGPWRVTTDGRTVDVPFSEIYTEVAFAAETTIEDASEVEANARLIAAAPELLELLRKIEANPWRPGASWVRADAAMRKEVREAIAKAEGRA